MLIIALVVLALAAVVWDSFNDRYLYGLARAAFSGFSGQQTLPAQKINDIDPTRDEKVSVASATTGEMVWIPGGWFWMGAEDPNHPMASPQHRVYVDAFWMDKYEVTNEQWAQFVEETGYKTIAEKPPDPKFFPNRNAEFIKNLPPCSLVFNPNARVTNLRDHLKWWRAVDGADWRHPEGPESDIKRTDEVWAKMKKHPVVHIAYLDAIEYCKWRSKKENATYRLPTEAEWEFAARGKLEQSKYTWGDILLPQGSGWMANIWQGRFPNENAKEDGYLTSAPVGSFPPNGYGLHDMAGNVWEWCNDWYSDHYYQQCVIGNRDGIKNPQGPISSYDPAEPDLPKRVQRGGSFLCHVSYCERYLTYARGKGEISSASNNVGFRCVREVSTDHRSQNSEQPAANNGRLETKASPKN